MSLLAGAGPNLHSCAWKKCRKLFEPKRADNIFCNEKCTQASACETYRRKRKPLKVSEKKCRQCLFAFQVVSTMNPVPVFCCSNCQRLWNVRRTRMRNRLLDLGWWREETEKGERWFDPDTGAKLIFEKAVARAGLRKEPVEHEITTDGVTVWVNGADGLLGRFGAQGIDVHRPLEEQASSGECLHCTHGPTTKKDWDVFRRKMLQHYGINIYRWWHVPRRFRTNARGRQETVRERIAKDAASI